MSGPTRCSGGPAPGMVKIRDKMMQTFPGLRDGGIYNCRNVRGGSTLSYHAGGRAWDAMTTDRALGDRVFAWCIANASALGLEELIWYRQIWTPSRGVHPYSGPNPHTDHVHIGISEAAGAAGPSGGLSGGSGGPLATATPVGLTEAAAGLERLVCVLTRAEFWLRVGLAAAGVLLIIAGALLVFGDTGLPRTLTLPGALRRPNP